MAGMRILHVTPYGPEAWAYGGIPRVVASLTAGLGRLGHDVTIVTTDACERGRRLLPPRLAPSRLAGEVRTVVFSNVSNALAFRLQLFLPLGLGAWLARHVREFDVAHLHGYHNLPGALAARALAARRIPYVVQPHGTAPTFERRILAKRLFDALFSGPVLPGAARLVAVSEAEREELQRLGVEAARIRVVGNPVDLRELEPPPDGLATRERLGIPGGEPLVAYLGTFTPRKNVGTLLRAVASLPAPRPWLVVAGSDIGGGPPLPRVAAELGIGSRARFPGLLRGRERLELLAAADAVAYAGSRELFGLVPLEAILCGTPAIVADDSGAGEVIGSTGGGLLVPPGDPAALAAAIGAILRDRTGHGQRVREAQPGIRARFGSDAVARAVAALYAEAAA